MREHGDSPRLIFVGTRRGNAFMNELLDAVAFEVAQLGFDTTLVFDAFPDAAEAVFVVIPHEFFATIPSAHHPSWSQLGRTIALCVEQPGTPWFDTALKYARLTGAAVDINAAGVKELRRRGVAAEHFQVGYTSHWDHWNGADAERPIDVIHLGTEAPRRQQALALYAADLWDREARVLLPAVERKTHEQRDFVTGRSKWAALAQSKILLNIHRQELAYFEWVRAVEAMCNGCVVVSEASRDASPLLPGEHFVSGRLTALGMLADRLLNDQAVLSQVRDAAYSFIRGTLPMATSAARLAELATGLAHAGESRRRRRPTLAAGPLIGAVSAAARGRCRRLLHRVQPSSSSLDHAVLAELQAARATHKRLLLTQIELARAVHRLELRPGTADVVELARTPAYEGSRPRVSVIVPLHNHEGEVHRALLSAARSRVREIELVVLDDGSTDCSRDTVCAFLERHPSVPALLLAHPVNRGLGPTRNALARAARGEFVLPLDADNELYPTAIEKLLAALENDPKAFFAYPILQVHVGEAPVGLLGYQPWDVRRLRRGGYIDALSLLRREQLQALGGYTEDMKLYGWEDYDLWCRAAASGLYGVQVPQILARYAKSDHSMLWVTNHDDSEAFTLLRRRYPEVFAPEIARRRARGGRGS